MISQRQSKRRRTVAVVAITSALVAGSRQMLTNTPLGADILLDYLGDDDSGLVADPAAGSLELSEFVTAVETARAVPPQIDQPSGMTYLEADRAFAIVTDQPELFVASDDITTVRSNTAVLDGLLVTRQGRMEVATNIDGQRIAVTGEIGNRIDIWRKDTEPGFSLEAAIDLSDYADGGDGEIDGVTHTLFVIDPEHGLLRVLGIENGGPISAIAVRGGTAYLPLDHNWVDPRPPLLAVTLD